MLDGHGFFPYYLSQAPWAAAGDRGIGLVLIGRPAQALDALADALVLSDPRWTVIVLAETAAARILQDEPEEACQQLMRALKLARSHKYAMGITRIHGIRDRFRLEWADLACIRRLDQLLQPAA
jgi:hypothetical protein